MSCSPALTVSINGKTQFEFLIRVVRVRQVLPRHVVVSALVVDPDGRPVPRAPNYAIAMPNHLSPIPLCIGQRWRVTGVPALVEYEADGGWRVQEMQFTATSALLERPSGSHIVSLLSSEHFPGVGPVTAQRAWDALGEALYQVLDAPDHDALERVVGFKHASILIDGWTYYGCPELLLWMQQVNLDVCIGRKLLKVYGGTALQRLREDPYRLLAFGMTWQKTDELASTAFELMPNDPRRLAAAVETGLYDAFDNGNTYALISDIEQAVERRIGPSYGAPAVALSVQMGVALCLRDRIYAPGPYLLERTVSSNLVERISCSVELFETPAIDLLIKEFEKEEQLRTGNANFQLNSAQQQAVHTAVAHNFFCLLGSAGVGKTTTLNAICFAFEQANLPTYLLAPTGKAAKRMQQATNRPAMTIAGFLVNAVPKGIPGNAVVVIDEASMLDIKAAYQLLLSLESTVRIILIGDPAQLPPVGPGLTLHELAACGVIPYVELTEGKRFRGQIATVANGIRAGQWTNLPSDHMAEVSFIPCENDKLASEVVSTYLMNPQDSQVLCCTKTSGAASSAAINRMCQIALASDAPRLTIFSEDRQRLEDTGFRLHDRVICTENLWSLDLQNGSMGRLETIEPTPMPLFNDNNVQIGTVYGWIRWDDGEIRPLTDEVLNALELAYAITVHKSQGSEFPIAIIPVYKTRILDRTLLYTAFTRARVKVILLGDMKIAIAAVEAEPFSAKRKVMLGALTRMEVLENV